MQKRRRRLLLTISEFMYSSQVRNICDLVSQLDKSLFDVEIGALAVGDEATHEIAALGVPYFRFRLQPTRPIRARDMATMAVSPFVLAAKRYDLVHSLLYQSICTEAMLVKHIGRAKYVYTKSNLDWDNHPGQWQLKSRFADRIVSISEATSELLRQKGFEGKTSKIYLGIDPQKFVRGAVNGSACRASLDIPADAFLFGCVAQFVEWKEHLAVVRGFEQVADAEAGAWLLICGPHHNDAYYHECRRYIESSRHASRIRLIGTFKDMPKLYSSLDAFVLASRFETFGYVYVEAMSCEVPVIGCRAAGPLEIINEGITGFFCEMSNPASVAQQMMRYVSQPGMAREHGRAGRARVEAIFSRQAMAKKTQEMYLDVLGERQG